MGLSIAEAVPHPVEERRVEERIWVEERAGQKARAAPPKVTPRLERLQTHPLQGEARLPHAKEITADATLRALPTPHLRLSVDGTRLRDAVGREVMLRGVNAGGRSKYSPFFPFAFSESGRSEQAGAPTFETAAAQYLEGSHKLGHNFLRVPFTWEAVEPTRGHYDEKYLSRLEQFIDLAAARGMRVLLDSHQDLFAGAYGGDGAPTWALSAPSAKQPWYGKIMWGLGYEFDPHVRTDFKRFWDNADGLQDDYARMLQKVARRLGGKPNVVGLDLYNEPDGGPLPVKAWARDRLTDFHSRMGTAVRAVSPQTPLFFEPPGRDGMRGGKTDTQKPDGEGWVFAPHYYDPARMTLSLAGMSAVNPLLGKVDALTPLGNWRAQGDKWNVPVVIGEFGIPRDGAGAPAQLERTYDALDAHRLSGTIWEYSTTTDDWNHEGMSLTGPGGVPTAASRASTRPFPAAIAGTLANFSWDAKEQRGAVAFEAKSGVSEIAMPAALVGDKKISVHVASDANVRWKYENEKLLVEADQPGHVVFYFALN